MPEYRVVPDGPKTFAVEVRFTVVRVELVRGFPSEAEAQAWVRAQQAKDAADAQT